MSSIGCISQSDFYHYTNIYVQQYWKYVGESIKVSVAKMHNLCIARNFHGSKISCFALKSRSKFLWLWFMWL